MTVLKKTYAIEKRQIAIDIQTRVKEQYKVMIAGFIEVMKKEIKWIFD